MKPRAQKILVVSYDFPPRLGGVATCAHKLCQALDDRPDIELRVIAPRHEGYEAFDAAQSFRVVRAPFCRRPRWASLGFTARVIWEVVRWRPTAMVCMLWFPDGLASFLATRLLFRVPYFVFAHGVEIMESEKTRWKRMRKRMSFLKRAVLRGARGVFAVSEFTKNLVHGESGIAPEKIHVVNNGVNCHEFFPIEKPEDLAKKYGTEGKFVFLSVSRLHDYKGMDQAIHAIRQLRETCPDILYLIGGTGPDHPRLTRLVAEHDLEDHVRFVGAIPQADLIRFYNLADCFVLLSRADLATPNVEGFGIVFLEAAACEKPVIAGRSGGTADAVEHGFSGWLVDPESPEAIARHMEQLVREPGRCETFGRNGRKRAEEKFTWGSAGAKVMEGIRAHVRN